MNLRIITLESSSNKLSEYVDKLTGRYLKELDKVNELLTKNISMST